MEQKDLKLKLTFCGGTGSVTGANFLIESPDKKFIIDCGLEQGTKLADDKNWDNFLYNAADIDILFITHAHVDHIGRIPKLYYDGFRGRIISTDATHDLALPMLLDTVQILGKSEEHNLHNIYTEQSVVEIMKLWEGVPYHQAIHIDHGFTCRFFDAGHVLGSGMLEMTYGRRKIVFTGDLGNSPSPLLENTEQIHDVDYIVMESVYGDRNHEHRDMRRSRLEQVINENYQRKGTLMIPTFSLERTQELLFEINELVENGKVPEMPIYLDSPLGIALTKIYRKYVHYFNDKARDHIHDGDDIFNFPGLKSTVKTDESKAILGSPNPKIIIAGSGMSSGGRILHHEKNYLPDPNNTILLTGYQSIGTLGRYIEEGAKEVTIMHETVPVRARFEKISGYSGHKDMDHLVSFIEGASNGLDKVFVTMGEPASSMFLAQRLHNELGVNAIAPQFGDSVEIDFS